MTAGSSLTLILILAAPVRLVVKFRTDLIKQLIEPRIRSSPHRSMSVIHLVQYCCAMRSNLRAFELFSQCYMDICCVAGTSRRALIVGASGSRMVEGGGGKLPTEKETKVRSQESDHKRWYRRARPACIKDVCKLPGSNLCGTATIAINYTAIQGELKKRPWERLYRKDWMKSSPGRSAIAI